MEIASLHAETGGTDKCVALLLEVFDGQFQNFEIEII